MRHIVVLNGGGFVCKCVRALALCLCLKLASESCNQTKGSREDANTPNIFCPQDFTRRDWDRLQPRRSPGETDSGFSTWKIMRE